ncbi:MAG: transposase [Verrucomicrobiaceae bacterium]|nr:transposase [Verrucomicrobiaceae bacterium]
MKNKRKRHDPQFKVRVALEALKGIRTVQRIAKGFGIHPGQVADWKKLLSEHAGSVFESGKSHGTEDFSRERTDLHSKIGEPERSGDRQMRSKALAPQLPENETNPIPGMTTIA